MEESQQDPALHPLLSTRWSPTTFDEAHVASSSDVEVLLEAARWAPSAGNSQPWAFIVGRRGDRTHQRLVRHLARSSAPWASTASLLVANLAHRLVEGTDWEYSEFSSYDLGQAVAHMTFQAAAIGLSVRQFRAFDRTALAAEFGVPTHWEITTMAAFGRVPPATTQRSPAQAGPRPRERHPLSDIRWPTA
jgi:nitroreductase